MAMPTEDWKIGEVALWDCVRQQNSAAIDSAVGRRIAPGDRANPWRCRQNRNGVSPRSRGGNRHCIRYQGLKRLAEVIYATA